MVHAAKEVETKHHITPSSRVCLDMLVEDLHTNNETVGHALYGCMLGTKLTGNNPNKLISAHFTKGGVKTQNNDMENMASLEHIA